MVRINRPQFPGCMMLPIPRFMGAQRKHRAGAEAAGFVSFGMAWIPASVSSEPDTCRTSTLSWLPAAANHK
jgi:hypothetical protein